MNELILAPIACRHCGAGVESADNYCRFCGTVVRDNETAVIVYEPAQVVESPATAGFDGVMQSRGFVVALLCCVGPLGLPLLWLHPRFKRSTKLILSVAFFLLTVVLPLAFAFYWLETAIRPLADALSSTPVGR